MPGIPPQYSEPAAGGSTRALRSDAAAQVAPDASFRSIEPHFEFLLAMTSLPPYVNVIVMG